MIVQIILGNSSLDENDLKFIEFCKQIHKCGMLCCVYYHVLSKRNTLYSYTFYDYD